MRRASLVACVLLAGCDGCDGGELTELIPLIAPSADALDFGAVFVGADAPRDWSARSAGTASLHLRQARVEGSAAFSLTGSFPGALLPGEAGTVELRFTPQEPGSFTAALVVTSDAKNDPELRVTLTGTGLPAADCDDGNPCTAGAFDPELGACVTTFVDAPCDDGSACTLEERCVQGACLGTAVQCDAQNACEIGVCAASEGCLSIPDAGACDDDNPCTLDECDPVQGCSHEPLPNGTPCAPPSGCAEARVCHAGTCTAVPVPDGTACSDGDLCTVADVCLAGLCEGERVEQEPEVVGTLRTFGAPGGSAVLAGDEVLFLDPTSAGVRVTAADTAAGELSVVAGGLLPGEGLAGPATLSLGEQRYLLFTRLGTQSFAVVMEQQPNGEIVELGRTGSLSGMHVTDIVRHDDIAFACRGSGATLVDLSVPAAPLSLGELPLLESCRSLALDESRARLHAATPHGIITFDVSAPASPVQLSVSHPDRSFWRLAASDNLLAADADTGAPAFSPSNQPLLFLDLEGLSVLGEIPEAGFPALVGVAFVDGGLLLSRIENGALLELWDVSEPGEPVLRHGELVGGQHHLYAAGALVVLSSQTMSAAVLRLTDEPSFARMEHPRQGGITHVRRRSSELFVFSGDALRSVSLADPTSPTVLALNLLPRRNGLVGLGAGGGAPAWLITSAPPDRMTHRAGTSLGFWLDASELSSAAVVRNTTLPLSAFRHLRSTGRRLYSMTLPTDDSAPRLELFSLEEPPAGFSAVLSPDASVEHPPLVDGDRPVFVSVAPDEDAGRVATASNHHDERSVEIAFFDVGDPASPSLLAHTYLQGLAVHGAALAGERLVVTGQRGDDAQYQAYSATELVLFARSAGDISQLSTLPLAAELEAGHVLAFDGTTAFVAARGAVLVFDVSGEPVLLGSVPTSGAVIDAAFAQDHLVLSSNSALDVVSPPCPPVP